MGWDSQEEASGAVGVRARKCPKGRERAAAQRARGAAPTGPDSTAAGRSPPPPTPYIPESGPPHAMERRCKAAPTDPLKGVGGWGVGMPEGGAGAERRGRGGGGGRPRQQRGWDLYRLAPSPDCRSVGQIILPVVWAGHVEIARNVCGLFGLVRPELPNGRIESISGHIALLHMHHGHLVGIRP